MADPQSPRDVVLLTTDLMLISSVGGAARQLGMTFRTVSSATELQQPDNGTDPLLCVDLAAAGDGIAELAAAVPQRILRQAVAFGPHVHQHRLTAARDAGFGRVLSRGQFVMNVRSVLQAGVSRGDE